MDRKMFEKLIEQQGDRIYNFCAHLCGNRDEAEELFQDTMLTAFERKDKIKLYNDELNEIKRAANYIIGISLKLNKNRLKRKGKEVSNVSLDDEEKPVVIVSDKNPETVFIKEEKIRLVTEAVKELPEKLGNTVYLYYYAEMGVEEIAKVLHIPKGTVMSRLYKAREKLKKVLEKDFDSKN